MTRSVALAAMLGLCCGASSAGTILSDDFTRPGRYERHGPNAWRLGDGVCGFVGAGGEAELVALGAERDGLTIRALVTVEGRGKEIAGTYTFAGVAVYADPQNYWRLLLVEGPDGKRYPELIERYSGEHQAQLGTASPAMRLEATTTGGLAAWEPARTYELVLSLGPEDIRGSIRDVDSGDQWERSYSFARGIAVRRGRGALVAGGLTGAFRSLTITSEDEGNAPIVDVPAGPRGAVVVLDDDGGGVAAPLAEALVVAGYGVRRLTWADLEDARLPQGTLSAFILADARRLPVRARDEIVTALHSQGKVLAIGAPALAELVAPTPDGYAGPEEYAARFATQLARTPIPIDPASWEHRSSSPEHPSSIEPDPAAGREAWHVECDLTNWDTYSVAVDLPPDDGLLVFEARGGPGTPRIAVEVTERDGSRWITGLDIREEWRTFVLRPADIPFWPDSSAPGRGGAGDRVVLRNARSIAVGLAKSHAPELTPGHYAYWFRGLSTAPESEVPAADFTVPAIETLCPSYKLYPLPGVATLTPAEGQYIVRQLEEGPTLGPAYAPVWRERGHGYNRDRAWRWVPVLSAADSSGKHKGALASLMIGDAASPNALWATVSVADPRDAVRPELLPVVVDLVDAMQRGTFLLEGGAELFSYADGEDVRLGAEVLNAGADERRLSVRVSVTDSRGEAVFAESKELAIPAHEVGDASWSWRSNHFAEEGYEVRAELLAGGQVIDVIAHRIERLRTEPGRPEEYVRVEGDHFTLDGKPWFFAGINYWPTWVAGYPDLSLNIRERYDPEIIERDLAWLESVGINAISAVQGIMPPDPESPTAFRDQRDFLDRCLRHGIHVHFTLHNGRPYAGADPEKLIGYIEQAGIKEHPAIMSWELAWEPIEGPWGKGFGFIVADWNAWIAERYGSADRAIESWGFDPRASAAGDVPAPTSEQCTQHGPHDRYVAAFRRAFSDLISREYGRLERALRAYDPNHLIAFRGGACGIPSGQAFAHIHSVGVAKHTDFLNPEGYNLQSWEWKEATPPDNIRKGGLITLYYRFISREKPVVWMEFGYTVNGIGRKWAPESVHLDPRALECQRQELESFYSMMIESGARGAAPWWLPGGFRVGEDSDFGILEPDGTERPSCEVVRSYNPRFATVEHAPATRVITLDLDQHYADAFETYSAEYLAAVKAGDVPYLATAGTGADSATCPLTAVGGTPYDGHSPPQFLNAEFGSLEIRVGDGPWRAIAGGEVVEVAPGEKVSCRASVGNLGEAAWLAPDGDAAGRVFLAGRAEYGYEFRAPIGADTAFLADARVEPFVLLSRARGEDALAGRPVTVSFEMEASGRAFFGERRVITLQRR